MKCMNSGTGIPEGYGVSFAPTSVGETPPEAAKVSRGSPEVGGVGRAAGMVRKESQRPDPTQTGRWPRIL